MSPITDVWRQLVRRRLWPVALLLVVALAAVPMMLTKEPEPVLPAPVPAGGAPTTTSALAADPIVALSGPEDRGADRRPLGDRHDIFKPTKKAPKVPRQAQAAAGGAPTGGAPSSSSSGSSGSSGSGSSGGGGGGATPAPTVPAPVKPKPKPRTYPLYSLDVRFGAGEGGMLRGTLPRLSALPSAEQPLVIYVGLLKDHKTAVFLLDSTVSAQGDGSCHPSPDNCETLRMRAGDTEFLDVVAADGSGTTAQYQLDLVKIRVKRTTDAARSARSARLARVAKAATLKGAARAGIGFAQRTG